MRVNVVEWVFVISLISGVQFLWTVAVNELSHVAYESIHVSLACRFDNDLLVIVVSQTTAQFLVVHPGFALFPAPKFSDSFRVDQLEFPAVPRPCYDVTEAGIEQKFEEKFPQLYWSLTDASRDDCFWVLGWSHVIKTLNGKLVKRGMDDRKILRGRFVHAAWKSGEVLMISLGRCFVVESWTDFGKVRPLVTGAWRVVRIIQPRWIRTLVKIVCN